MKKQLISHKQAKNILSQINHTKCHICIFRDTIINCRVTALTMVNNNGDCIWYQKGNPDDDNGLDIELAKKRMNGKPIYFSTTEMVEKK